VGHQDRLIGYTNAEGHRRVTVPLGVGVGCG
jgi:hypothetical protein